MGLLKPAGQSASDTRRGTLHGSISGRRMAKWGGALRRGTEKPESAPPPANKSKRS